MTVAMILQKFDVTEHNPQYVLKVKETLTIKPEGFYMHATPRKNRPHVPSAIPSPSSPPPATATATSPVLHQTTTPAVPSKRGRGLLVLYGSNSGSSEAFAQRLHADALSRGYTSHLDVLDAHSGNVDGMRRGGRDET